MRFDSQLYIGYEPHIFNAHSIGKWNPNSHIQDKANTIFTINHEKHCKNAHKIEAGAHPKPHPD